MPCATWRRPPKRQQRPRRWQRRERMTNRPKSCGGSTTANRRKTLRIVANGPTLAQRPKAMITTDRTAALTCCGYETWRKVNRKRRIVARREKAGKERGAGGSRTHEWRFCKPQTHPENPRENGVPVLPGSKSAAVAAEISQDLQALIDAWPALPDALRVGILAMVSAASQAAR